MIDIKYSGICLCTFGLGDYFEVGNHYSYITCSGKEKMWGFTDSQAYEVMWTNSERRSHFTPGEFKMYFKDMSEIREEKLNNILNIDGTNYK